MAETQIEEPLEIRKVLVLGVEHLTKETCLGYRRWPHIAEYESGCYFYVGNEPASSSSIPSDLQAVLAFARQQGCVEVKFDADADYISQLPRYDW